MESSEIRALTESLASMVHEIREFRRPRIFVDIGPRKGGHVNMLEVSITNAGYDPAFDIACVFEPDLPYGGQTTTMSQLPIFQRLDFLLPHDEIRFFFDSAVSYLNRADVPKKTVASLTYFNSRREKFVETLPIDLERYKKLLWSDKGEFNDLVQRIDEIGRTLERATRDGVIIKTTQDLARERKAQIALAKKWKEKSASKETKRH